MSVIVAILCLFLIPGTTERVKAAEIKLNKKTLILFKGESFRLKLENIPDNGQVKWTVTAPKRVKISKDGTVYGLKKGKATVRAEYEGKIYKCKVTVKPVPINGNFSDEDKYRYLFGTKVTYWTTDNKPAGYGTKDEALKNMTTFNVPVYLMNSKGEKISGKRSIMVNSLLAKDVKAIFKEIYALEEMFPVDTLTGFRWNSKGEVSGPLLDNVTCMSAHAYGAAIDINCYQNDYYVGAGNDLRDTGNPYYITENVRKIFEKHGWYWGGDYAICSDTMHFQYTGLDMLSYNTGSPFTEYIVTKPTTYSVQVKNIQRRLNRLGFDCGAADGYYGANTEKAVKAFSEKYLSESFKSGSEELNREDPDGNESDKDGSDSKNPDGNESDKDSSYSKNPGSNESDKDSSDSKNPDSKEAGCGGADNKGKSFTTEAFYISLYNMTSEMYDIK